MAVQTGTATATKKIEFFCGLAYAKKIGSRFRTVEIDLDKLSPTARKIAESIETTDWNDDYGVFMVRSTNTYAERLLENGSSPEYVDRLRKVYGAEMVDTPIKASITVEKAIYNDTTDPYKVLEDTARDIDQNGFEVVGPFVKRRA